MNLVEQGLIGCLLIDDSQYAISKIHDKVKAEMFLGSAFYGRVYLEYQRGYENHYPVDYTIVRQKLYDDGYTEQEVRNGLETALENAITSENVEGYAEGVILRFKAFKLNKILKSTKVKPSKVYDQISVLQTELDALKDGEEINAQSLPQIVEKYRMEYFVKHPTKMNFGFRELDEIVGGFEGGDLTVIGARPGVGKSAFVTQFVSRLGKEGKRIGFYNLEMTDKQMYERFIVSESGLGLSFLRNAESCSAEDMQKFNAANEILAKQDNIRIIDDGAKTVAQIRSESLHMNYDLIVVDYLQLLKPGASYKGNRQAEVGEISRSLKNLAKELKIPVIALSQLNRVSEARETKEPTMSELREAGNIEQDASIIIMLWNLDGEDRNLKGCKVDKNRQGKLGRVTLRFNGEEMKFEELHDKNKKTPHRGAERANSADYGNDLNDNPFL